MNMTVLSQYLPLSQKEKTPYLEEFLFLIPWIAA